MDSRDNRCHPLCGLQTFGYHVYPMNVFYFFGEQGKNGSQRLTVLAASLSIDSRRRNRLYSGEEVDRRRIARLHNNEVSVMGAACRGKYR